MTQCFLIKPHTTAYAQVIRTEPSLFSSEERKEGACSIWGTFHRGERLAGTFECDPDQQVPDSHFSFDQNDFLPLHCDCGFPFTEASSISKGLSHFWVRIDTNEVKERISQFGVGAMWFATWYLNKETGLYGWNWANQTTPSLIVRTPGGEWDIDSRASNCTMPDDKLHRCWVRHGEPPNITVDKNGLTCGAGAGSIISGNYHGFLQGGRFT